jgi:uncharacterized membrane protein
MTPKNHAQYTTVPYVLRVVLSRPAFWGSLLLGVVVAWIVPPQVGQPWLPRLIVGWNAGAAVLLLFSAWHIFGKPRTSIRVLAVLQQEGRLLVLGLVVALVLLCLGCIVAELALARELSGPQSQAHLVLAGLSWLTAWAVTQVMFALHYAQGHFFAQVQGTAPVLRFVDGRNAAYRDFLGLALATGTLGRSTQASLLSPGLRRAGLLQRLLALLFALTLLVLVVNLAAG